MTLAFVMLALFAAALLSARAVAQTPPEAATHHAPLPGTASPAFATALADWLDDDDAAALPALAALAAGHTTDNGAPSLAAQTAARLLLGLIDRHPALQGPWLMQRPRAERMALLRAPGGLSGRNWLALTDHPLAQAWQDLTDVGAGLPLVQRFTDLGEPRAARTALAALAAREHPDLRRADPEAIDPEQLYLIWRAAPTERRAMLAGLIPPDQPQAVFAGQPADATGLARWLSTHAPIAALCDARCPPEDAAAACRLAAYTGLNSHDAALRLGSPAEALVDSVRFVSSARGQAQVLRRMLLNQGQPGSDALVARLRPLSACLSDALQAEATQMHAAQP